MSDLLNAAKQARAGAKKLEWIIQLADALEQVGSIDQATYESNVRLAEINDVDRKSSPHQT